ncbi:MAG: sulfatase-like hydrolase/transferase [Prevotella sp.]|jgi:arylsulfatase|nr:sulfatase-like hydrolase/transferase [Prevotella sp.]
MSIFRHKNTIKQFTWTAALLPSLTAQAEKPNIIIIMADDMGYSDIGCYGGEIHTPSIDSLAAHGLRYTNFYNGARSCPTRAALISGLYAHKAGMGWMAAAYEGEGGYQGDLSKNALTIAEYLKSGGYNTYMSGKWHLSNHQKNDQSIRDSWPYQRGFEHFFGIIGGAASYFTPNVFSNNKRYKAPANFYLTDAISDTAVAYINTHNQNKPFFMYVAYTAPHWPLHARAADIAKYAGQYSIGWDQLRQNRLQKQKNIGLIDDRYVLTPRDASVNAWANESQKNNFAKRMEIYAAQIDVMDEGIGRIVQALKDKGIMDNTLIFFLSDNGACAEQISSGESTQPTGEDNTYESYRRAWANASNTPYREYKHFAHEGGIKTPMIVHWPNGVSCPTGGYEHTNAHLIDIYKTIADITQIPYPATYNGNTIIPLQGSSFLPNFSGTPVQREPIFWEHEGNIAVRMGDWKLVTKPTGSNLPGTLELYNLANDPTELHDLAASNSAKKQELWDDWFDWATANDVFPLSTLSDSERTALEPRYLNGEFNAGLYGWTFNIAGTGAGTLNLNTSSVISGKYSAEIAITQTGEKPNNILLYWPVNLKQGERCKLRFKVKANKAVNMLVRLEKASGTFAKIIDESIDVTTSVKTYEFDSPVVPATEGNRIGFYFGSSVPATVWLDEVELLFINQESLSPSWDFGSVAGASYKLSFEGKGAQLWTPVKVFLRKVDAPSEIRFSQTVYFTSAWKPFELTLPTMPADEKLFVQFEFPAYASKDCQIQNIALDVSPSGLSENRLQSPYNIEYLCSAGCRIRSSGHEQFRAELFSLKGEKLDEQKGEDVVLSLSKNSIYILRLTSSKADNAYVSKLLLH